MASNEGALLRILWPRFYIAPALVFSARFCHGELEKGAEKGSKNPERDFSRQRANIILK